MRDHQMVKMRLICTIVFGVFIALTAAHGQSFVELDVRVVHTFEGEAPQDVFGWVSVLVDDLDNDDVDDLIITATGNDAGGSNAGRAYAYSSVTGQLIHVFTGQRFGDALGYAVDDAGRIDEDDVTDIILSAPGGFGVGRGKVLIYSGASGDLIREIDGENVGDNFGTAARNAGDMDGDLIPDFLIGAPRYDSNNGADSGAVYIFSGADGKRIKRIKGFAAGDNFGSSVGSLGDINDDNVPDFIVGSPNSGDQSRGRAYVFSGIDFALLCELAPLSSGVALGSHFVSSPGDINGDQKPDILAADWQDRARGQTTGRAYLYSYDGKDCVSQYILTGASAGQGLGIGNGRAGDVNQDGIKDVLSGLWVSSDGAFQAGKVQVFNGPDGQLIRNITSKTARENLGYDAHTMEDVTGDGFPDFLITAASNSESGPNTGKVYLIAGNNPFPGDFDADRDVDLSDYGSFVACITGPGIGPINPDCWNADMDFDDDVDMGDAALFVNAFTGEE